MTVLQDQVSESTIPLNTVSTSADPSAHTNALPQARPQEPPALRTFFEKRFFKRVKVDELLVLAATARGGSFTCTFGERDSGLYNIVLTICFDDGVEWVTKMPKSTTTNKDNEYLKSEYATLLFLQDLGTPVPVAHPHGYCFNRKNPAKTPYIFMDKVSGMPLADAISARHMNRGAVHRMLSQLAEFRKTLGQHSFTQIGSLTLFINETECSYYVNRQYIWWSLHEDRVRYHCDFGPYQSSLHYYSMLLHNSWNEWMAHEYSEELGPLAERLRLHAYLTSITASYAKPSDVFYLTHTDMHAGNIFVDTQGNITGIIDWEFASTLPSQAAEHYPQFLANDLGFIHQTSDIYPDAVVELRHWQDFYAQQWAGDAEMQEYFANIDAIIEFEELLRDAGLANIQNVVENLKLVDSATTLENLQNPFPWTTPTVISSPDRTVPHEARGPSTVGSGDNSPGLEADRTIKDETGAEGETTGEEVSEEGVANGAVAREEKKGRWKKIKVAVSRFYHGVLCASETEHSRRNGMPTKVS
jgi:Phosphotransferase enzyme family